MLPSFRESSIRELGEFVKVIEKIPIETEQQSETLRSKTAMENTVVKSVIHASNSMISERQNSSRTLHQSLAAKGMNQSIAEESCL